MTVIDLPFIQVTSDQTISVQINGEHARSLDLKRFEDKDGSTYYGWAANTKSAFKYGIMLDRWAVWGTSELNRKRHAVFTPDLFETTVEVGGVCILDRKRGIYNPRRANGKINRISGTVDVYDPFLGKDMTVYVSITDLSAENRVEFKVTIRETKTQGRAPKMITCLD